MSSWLRSVMTKAAEVGNNNNITNTFRNYADTVVQQAGQAVAEGAKLLQDRIGAGNIKSAKYTIKRLEEAAVSCKGAERVQLLRRWVVVLKEVEKSLDDVSEGKGPEEHVANDESKDSPSKPSVVLYFDTDAEGEPMTFRDVFLKSQALEGITLSMILEAPNEDEVALLLEMYRLCLTGGKEIHNAIVSSIQDLANAFSDYEDEVLVKREELLLFAQNAITGLKLSADIGRIDAEAKILKKKLDATPSSLEASNEGLDKVSKEMTKATIESLKCALSQIRACSRLEGLLLRKQTVNSGDTPEIHAQKVDKLKILSESLANSTTKSEKRIVDNRVQKEEALNVRVAKASEIGEKENELSTEIAGLEKQRDDLEAELKKVNISLAAAQARLRDAREERDQFNEANNQINRLLKTKEEELLKSIISCKIEGNVIRTWVNFLEDTWALQRTYTETNKNLVNDEMEKHENYFVDLVVHLLSTYKKELGPAIKHIGTYVEKLSNLSEGPKEPSTVEMDETTELNPRKKLEEEYFDNEAKIVTTFTVVDHMKEQFYAHQGQIPRKDDGKVKALFDDIEKLRGEFESTERPTLKVETPVAKADTPRTPKPRTSGYHSPIPDNKIDKHPVSGITKSETELDAAAELAKLESEFGKVSDDYLEGEIGDWEFDEIERELKLGDSPSK